MVNTKPKAWVQPKKVFRQHYSLIVTLPVFVREKLDIHKGDYVFFEWKPGQKFVKVRKLKELSRGKRRTS